MKRIFTIMALAILAIWALNAQAQEVTLDFTENTWGLPNDSKEKLIDAAQYTSGGYTIIMEGSTGGGYYYHSTGKYVLIGKQGASLTLPAFNFDVAKIAVTGTSGASAAVKQNIFVGEEAISTETTGAKNVTNEYDIPAAYQAAGTIYKLQITSAHNTQITKIEIFKNGSTTPTKATPEMSFNPSSVSVTIGESVTAPTLSYNGDGAVTYASSHEDVATVDASTGALSILAVGTTTITATAAETANYKSASAQYTLLVKSVPVVIDDAIWSENWDSYEAGTKVEDMSNPAATYTGDDGQYVKLYANSSDATNMELLVPKSSRGLSFTANINLAGNSGNLTLTYYANKAIDVTTTTAGATVGEAAVADNTYTRTITVAAGTDRLILTFSMSTDSNGRLDNIVIVPAATKSVANIADFKSLPDGTEAKLTLNDAYVLWVHGSDAYVRDASGAIDFYGTGLSLTVGTKLNGSIIGKRATYNKIPELGKSSNTNADGFTVTEGAATAKTITLAQANGETYFCDLVKIEGVKITSKEEGKYTNVYAYIGTDSVMVFDRFGIGLGNYNETDTYDVEGILVPFSGKYEIYITKSLVKGGGDCAVTAEAMTINTGETAQLPIFIANNGEIDGMQFDFTLPAGVTVAADMVGGFVVTTTDRSNKLTATCAKIADNTYRVILLSINRAIVAAGNGAVLNIQLQCADDVTGGDYDIAFTNVSVSRVEGDKSVNVKVADFTAPLTIVEISKIPGDVDGNFTVDVTDVMIIVDYILNRPCNKFNFANADLDGDGIVNVTDAMNVVNIILHKSNIRVSSTAQKIDRDLLRLGTSETGCQLHTAFDSPIITALQMEVTLPEGCRLNSVSLTGRAVRSHMVKTYQLSDQTYNVVVFSIKGSALDTDAPFLQIDLEGNGGLVEIENILCTDTNHESLTSPNLSAEVTGITTVTADDSSDTPVYNLAGQRLAKPRKGINITNGKKMVVK